MIASAAIALAIIESGRGEQMKPPRLRRPLLALWLVVFLVSVMGATKPPRFTPPRTYYLVLGDSITYGYQKSKYYPGAPASAFTTGYVDDFAARLN
jgi:lysophospholipase L1-like esterase